MFDKVEFEIIQLSSNSPSGTINTLLLKEIDGNRRLPIAIGAAEAQAIAVELGGQPRARPSTHDLMKSLIINMNSNLREVVIHDLIQNVFYCKVVLDISSMSNEVDARPSDAIALAVRFGAPIYVTESVLKLASFSVSSEESESESKHESSEDDFHQNFRSFERESFDEEDEEEKNTESHSSSDDDISVGSTPKATPAEARYAFLQNQLREALEKEDYERAAILRDEIKRSGF